MDSIFRDNETKKSSSFNTKNTFMGIQMNIEMTTLELSNDRHGYPTAWNERAGHQDKVTQHDCCHKII